MKFGLFLLYGGNDRRILLTVYRLGNDEREGIFFRAPINAHVSVLSDDEAFHVGNNGGFALSVLIVKRAFGVKRCLNEVDAFLLRVFPRQLAFTLNKVFLVKLVALGESGRGICRLDGVGGDYSVLPYGKNLRKAFVYVDKPFRNGGSRRGDGKDSRDEKHGCAKRHGDGFPETELVISEKRIGVPAQAFDFFEIAVGITNGLFGFGERIVTGDLIAPYGFL